MSILLEYINGMLTYRKYVELLKAEQVDESRDDTREG